MKVSPADWTAAIIGRLALNPATRLTLALDPDGLLLDETVLSVIQAQGIGVLTLRAEAVRRLPLPL